jgi:predicted ATPase
MITRIEIDGFKSFDEFALDLRPFNVLAGLNNSGKSNLLEAIELLGRLLRDQEQPLVEHERGAGSQLFRARLDGTQVPEFGIRAVTDVVPSPGSMFPDEASVTVRQEADGLGVAIQKPHGMAGLELSGASVLSPLAARMRVGAALDDKRRLQPDGANLAAVLGRIVDAGLMPDLEMAAGFVIEQLREIKPVRYPQLARWELELEFSDRGRFPAALVSDGTLRILALLAAVYDPRGARSEGIILVDELENGLHPAYQRRLVEVLRRQANGNRDLPQPQIIATTHSPVVLAAVLDGDPQDAVFLNQATGNSRREGAFGGPRSFTRARRIADSGEPGSYMPRREVQRYLDSTKPESVVLG